MLAVLPLAALPVIIHLGVRLTFVPHECNAEGTLLPQTVIIDADGNVAEIFIGANPGFAEQLRTTIQGLLTPNQKPQPPDASSKKP